MNFPRQVDGYPEFMMGEQNDQVRQPPSISIPTGTRGPACIVWAGLTPLSLQCQTCACMDVDDFRDDPWSCQVFLTCHVLMEQGDSSVVGSVLTMEAVW